MAERQKEIIVKLTIRQAQAAWRLLSNVDAGCEDDILYRTCDTASHRITNALLDAGEDL